MKWVTVAIMMSLVVCGSYGSGEMDTAAENTIEQTEEVNIEEVGKKIIRIFADPNISDILDTLQYAAGYIIRSWTFLGGLTADQKELVEFYQALFKKNSDEAQEAERAKNPEKADQVEVGNKAGSTGLFGAISSGIKALVTSKPEQKYYGLLATEFPIDKHNVPLGKLLKGHIVDVYTLASIVNSMPLAERSQLPNPSELKFNNKDITAWSELEFKNRGLQQGFAFGKVCSALNTILTAMEKDRSQAKSEYLSKFVFRLLDGLDNTTWDQDYYHLDGYPCRPGYVTTYYIKDIKEALFNENKMNAIRRLLRSAINIIGMIAQKLAKPEEMAKLKIGLDEIVNDWRVRATKVVGSTSEQLPSSTVVPAG